jgi:hypothetical protein
MTTEYADPTCPLPREFVVICTWLEPELTEILSDPAAVCGGELESFILTVKREVPACVGIPVTVPDGERPKPVGSCPEVSLQLYGAVPPVADKAAL